MNIALIAHDSQKPAIIDWCIKNEEFLSQQKLSATGTTGKLITEKTNLKIQRYASGPLGGDQQIGSLIVEKKIDVLVFFWDPLSSQPHDVDVKALLRLAVLYNIPTACNISTANHLIKAFNISEDK